MKPKVVILLVFVLLLAMVPALVMAQSQAKPQHTFRVVIDSRLPIGPQIAAVLGGSKPGGNAPAQSAPAKLGIQPKAVQVLLNEGFEGAWPAGTGWTIYDLSFSGYNWGATDYIRKRGQQSAWSAGDGGDPYFWPYYENYMETVADYPMDLTYANRGSVRFQFRSDTEYFWDAFLWCGSPDQIWYYCNGHTGSTNGTWRLVNMNLNNVPGYGSILGEPYAAFALWFYSDFSIVDAGTYVDALRIRATGPNP